MLAPPDGWGEDYTPYVPIKSERCKACGSANSDVFVFPSTNTSQIICLECVRGAVIAVTKEMKRRNDKTPPKRRA